VLKPGDVPRSSTATSSRQREWNAIPVKGGGELFLGPDSTYIQEPPFFVDMPRPSRRHQPIRGARVLVLVGDS
jgi:aconitate hydratase